MGVLQIRLQVEANPKFYRLVLHVRYCGGAPITYHSVLVERWNSDRDRNSSCITREALEEDVQRQQRVLYGPLLIVERVQSGVTTNLLKPKRGITRIESALLMNMSLL